MTGHIHEELLALYIFQRGKLAYRLRASIERHLAACAECQATSDFMAAGEQELTDPEIWEPVVGSAAFDAIDAYAARIRAEDEEAEELLRPYVEKPVDAVWGQLTQRNVFRTGGVVRKLNAYAHRLRDEEPLAALTFADAAISIAEVLPDKSYPARALAQMRATAWKERANALMRLGQFPAAHDALDCAQRYYEETAARSLGLAIVALIRAGVLYEQGRYGEAMLMAERAEQGFADNGDEKRRMDAVLLRGAIKMEAGDATTALELYRQLIDYGENTNDFGAIARGSYACGNAEVDRGNLNEASLHFHRALVLFRELGPVPDRIATEWGIARIVLKSGRLDEAVRRYRNVQEEFEQLGIVTDAALVGLDIAEAFIALGRLNEIAPLAHHIFRIFERAGMLTGALSAIAYLKEAAIAKRLTPGDVDAVRRFLRRAEREPALVFAPPPPSWLE